jgi:phage gp36-like protein
MITDTEFKKRYDKYTNVDVTTFLEDATKLALSTISNRYNSNNPMETDIEVIVERCVYDLTNVFLLRRSAATLNDSGQSDLYKQTMKLLNDINNGIIVSTIQPVAQETPQTESIIFKSQIGYYYDEFK